MILNQEEILKFVCGREYSKFYIKEIEINKNSKKYFVKLKYPYEGESENNTIVILSMDRYHCYVEYIKGRELTEFLDVSEKYRKFVENILLYSKRDPFEAAKYANECNKFTNEKKDKHFE